jgi:phytoene dehydrogenase-like protein
VKAALAVNGVIGTWAGPYAPGTAYVMAHHSIGDVGDGHLGNWGFQEGGMGAVAAAIERAARGHGAEIRTGARVARVTVSGDRAAGVALDTGEEIRARAVVSTLPPRTAFLDHVGENNLPADFVRDISNWKTRSGVVKINLALAELPDFTADPGSDLQEHHTGSVEMAPSVEYIERAFQDAREGRPAARPFSDGVIPTAFDTTLCPEGSHIMSLFTQWVPSDWSTEPHNAELEAYADRMIDCYNELAPNFKASILHRDILGPYQLEHEYGLIGGNIFHGELSLEQLFHMRPAPGFADYRTPVPGLYYASSATHAGGGVCGIPGWQAARAAIADQKAARRAAQLRKITRRT